MESPHTGGRPKSKGLYSKDFLQKLDWKGQMSSVKSTGSVCGRRIFRRQELGSLESSFQIMSKA